MTINQIRRLPEDPEWSGRLVQGSDGGWMYEDCNLSHLQKHLEMAWEVALKLRTGEKRDDDQHSLLPSHSMYDLANLYELVDSLQRCLPWVLAWCNGREVAEGSDGTPAHFEVFSAHETELAAHQWVTYWYEQKPAKFHPITIKMHPVPILSVLDRHAIPGQVPVFA